jgi:hypothetical protein
MWNQRIIAMVSLATVGCTPANHDPTGVASASAQAQAPAAASAAASAAPVTAPAAAPFASRSIALPGGSADGVGMDFLLFDPTSASVWVPAGNTGSVDAIEATTGKVTRIEGFATREMEGRDGNKRTVGPSSVTVGEGTIYVGNRGDSTICAIDPKARTKTSCGPKLDSMPDGIVYVSSTKEVWVTTPKDKSIRILDGKTLKQKEKLSFDGEPEGYAVDGKRGRFYTNLEDKDQTLAIDIVSHKTVSTWSANCGEQGPHGVRLAEGDGLLFIACSSKIETMDIAHDGRILSSLETGDGVDDIDYVAATRSVYAGAAKAAVLVIAHADDHGALTETARVPTQPGARNAAVDAAGNVYLSHAKGSEIIVVSPKK